MPKTRSGVAYVVRESTRAKRVIIKVRMSSDLEVVVPIGFALDRLPEILDRRTKWIDTQRKRFREMKRAFRPKRIVLDAIGQVWTVEYIGDARKGVSVEEGEGTHLALRGQVDDLKLVVKVLNAMGQLFGPKEHQSQPKLALSTSRDGQVRADTRAMPCRPIEPLR